MNNVLVTGAKGFIGKNIISVLKEKKIAVFEFDIKNSIDELDEYIKNTECIIHLAGVNRPKNDLEFKKGNTDFTSSLILKVKETGRKIPVLFSSSIQAEYNNPYGDSKKKAESIILDYIQNKNPGIIYRLHNVFGKWSKPNYNSVVATFCYNIVNDLDININDPEYNLELVYIDDVIDQFIKFIDYPVSEINISYIDKRSNINIKKLVDLLYYFKKCLRNGIIPDLSNVLQKQLFSTFLSYFSRNQIVNIPKINSDDRGELFEFIKSENSGQVFVSTTKPGITRGNHYHHTKIEKFCVIKGQALIKLRHLITNEISEYNVDGNEPKIIHIPPGYTHNITNIGNKDMIALFWANEIFDNKNSDTYRENV